MNNVRVSMIRFTSHAILKLTQRNIAREQVERTIDNPDHMRETYGNRKALYKKFGTKYLKVVVTEESGTTTVITQHWDSSFNP